LLSERWDDDTRTLSGTSTVVGGDPYAMTAFLPEDFRLETAEVGGRAAEIVPHEQTATVRTVPSATETIEWKMTFAK